MDNSAILLFCGCDKTGKSTIIKEILKRTNEYICVDRFVPCQIIYGKLHKKYTPQFLQLEEFLKDSPIPFIYVHVHAATSTIKQRFEEHNETDIDINQIDLVKKEYNDYFDSHKNLPIININTTIFDLNLCVDYLLRRIKQEVGR